MNLMESIRESIKSDRFPEFVEKFFNNLYPKGEYPKWAQDALKTVGIFLEK